MTDKRFMRPHGINLLCLNCKYAYDIHSTLKDILRAPLLSPGSATLGFCCEFADLMKTGREQYIVLRQIRTVCEHYVPKVASE